MCDQHIFHIMVFEGLTYMCMAEEDFGRLATANRASLAPCPDPLRASTTFPPVPH